MVVAWRELPRVPPARRFPDHTIPNTRSTVRVGASCSGRLVSPPPVRSVAASYTGEGDMVASRCHLQHIPDSAQFCRAVDDLGRSFLNMCTRYRADLVTPNDYRRSIEASALATPTSLFRNQAFRRHR